MHATLRKAALKALFHRNDGVDMRSRGGQRTKALVLAYLDEMDHEPNEAELAALRAAASQRLSLEALEKQALAKGAPLPKSYCTLSRLLERNLRALRVRPVHANANCSHDRNQICSHDCSENVHAPAA
jgi:hypothetical protein